MRGKPIFRRRYPPQVRITPADAGKTAVNFQLYIVHRDHPRGCGENASSGCPRGTNLGSPPRMRGKPIAVMISGSAPRITPADAGKTDLFAGCVNRLEDHPRGCGENRAVKSRMMSARGSPPRMRGKRLCASDTAGHARITPADAGKTFVVFNAHCFEQDHPRGCGENCLPVSAAG